MDIMPFHFLQAVLADAVQEARGCAVIQNLRRCLRRVLQIHLDRMALARADALAIVAEREALFIARRNDVLELVQRESDTVAVHRLQQFVHAHPTRFTEL